LNNGYIINEYTNATTHPNKKNTDYSLHGYYEHIPEWFLRGVESGSNPLFFNDFSVKRRKLISSRIYSSSDKLLKDVFNEYEHKIYDELNIIENVLLGKTNFNYSTGQNVGHARFTNTILSESFNLTETTTNQHTSSGVISNQKAYVHHPSKPFIKEKHTALSDGSILKEQYSYPFDDDVLSMPNIADLNALNILTPIKTSVLKNDKILKTSLTSYLNHGRNKILPEKTKTAKGSNSLEVITEFHEYDKRGNLLEYSKKNGIHITVLWGHNYKSKIAEIIGATLKEVLSTLNLNSEDELQAFTDEELTILFDGLRSSLQNAKIYSYIQTPLVGITKITKPNGDKNSYTYDTFNRLEFIKDRNNTILSQNTYNYKLKSTITNIIQEDLTLSITKNPTDFYMPAKSALLHETLLFADAKGGKGDYTYEWNFSDSSTVLTNDYDYVVRVPCGESKSLDVKVVDGNGTQISKTVTVRAANCGEPFYVSEIQGYSGTNNQNNFWVETEENDSYKYTYQWFISNPDSSAITSYDNHYDNSSSLLRNSSGGIVPIILSVKITDENSGYSVVRTRSVSIQPEFEINSCFVAGTKITMSNGSQKNIEDVNIGDKVLTYDTKIQKIKAGEVKNIATPEHTKFVEFRFENDTKNTNTLDHPYYVIGKGWSSYDPEMTKIKYDLEVNKIELGDNVLLFDETTKRVGKLKLTDQKLISKTQKTYNLEKVSENHNFFANGILVHNKSKD
ncbi:hypothetical protein OAC88_03625, partial [Flavobacteriaceae bacterium]|nr:hypothetical protein [Flavobacteriaceae bacterium]